MKWDRRNLHQVIYKVLSLAIAFTIPVYGILIPPLIALFTINWLFEGGYVRNFPVLWREKPRRNIVSFTVLYFIYLAGMLYSRNLTYGFFDLEVKLSLVLFPIIFATSDIIPLFQSLYRKIFTAFIAGSFTGTMILTGRALYRSQVLEVPDAIYYSNLSWHFHPGYFALYLTFAISILVWYLFFDREKKPWPQKTWMVLLLIWFILFIFMLSSKAGLLGLALAVLVLSSVLIFAFRKVMPGILLLLSFALIFYGGIRMFPYIGGRISQAEQEMNGAKSNEKISSSTGERKAIWNLSKGIIHKHWILGVGTGDVKDTLMTAYKEHDFMSAYQSKLNAHNQYLQTWISIGLAGLVALILMLVIPAYYSFRKGNYLYFVFLIVFAANLLVESMLETQAGVVFYAFFNCILFIGGDYPRNR